MRLPSGSGFPFVVSGHRLHAGSQGVAELVVGEGEVFGLDAGLADSGQEVGVAGPAREEVQVEVGGDAGRYIRGAVMELATGGVCQKGCVRGPFEVS